MLVLIAVAAAGATGAAQVAMAIISLPVLPLFYAARETVGLVAGPLVQSALGAAYIWLIRDRLWPRSWAEAERALPLRRRTLVASDFIVVTGALTPLLMLYLVGAIVVVYQDPVWLHAHAARGVAAVIVAGAGSIVLGVLLLQMLRRPPRASMLRGSTSAAKFAIARHAWFRSLLLLPLQRMPGRDTRRSLASGSVVLLLPSVGLAARPEWCGWWLAGFALIALLATTRTGSAARHGSLAILEASAPLPIRTATLRLAWVCTALVPLLIGGAALLLSLARVRTHPLALSLYVLASAGSCGVEAFSGRERTVAKASRWLVSLVIMIACGSEVLA